MGVTAHAGTLSRPFAVIAVATSLIRIGCGLHALAHALAQARALRRRLSRGSPRHRATTGAVARARQGARRREQIAGSIPASPVVHPAGPPLGVDPAGLVQASPADAKATSTSLRSPTA